MRIFTSCFTCLFLYVTGPSRAQTPLSYPMAGAFYTQNFDGLPASGSFSLAGRGPFNLSSAPFNGTNLTGWQILMTGGSNASAAFAVSTGSSTGNAVYSLGPAGGADRALGSLSSGTGIYSFGCVLTNHTGASLNTFTISFTNEQWRKGGTTNRNTWSFRYKTGVFSTIEQAGLTEEPALNMVSLITTSGGSSLNGRLPENAQAISFTIHSVNWKSGEQLLLRWDDADENGNDDVCGMNDMRFSASLETAAPSAVTLAADSISSHSAVLHGMADDHFLSTDVLFEYDTTNAFIHALLIPALPGTIHAGTGNSPATALIDDLLPGHIYFFRIRARNALGSDTGILLNFTTPFELPLVTSLTPSNVLTNSATLGGNIRSAGSSVVTDRGIVWDVHANPTLLHNRTSMGSDTGSFLQKINGLPGGSFIYARAYATSTAGTAYGNTVSFTTSTNILSLTPASLSPANSATVNFRMKTAEPVTGLSVANFSLLSQGVNEAFITAITGSANQFTLTVNTGSGDGSIGLQLSDDAGLSPAIYNKPYLSTTLFFIDKTAPVIRSASIPDRPMKTGDTVPVIIRTDPDPDTYQSGNSSLRTYPLGGFLKKNDSVYQASFIITKTGGDLNAMDDIPVNILLTDVAGNASRYQLPIVQSSDPVDVTNPFITGMSIPVNGVYKAGDTLRFVFHFNEKIQLTGSIATAAFSVTIGSRTKRVLYATGDGTASLLFRYIIQPGESDKDGIRLNDPVTFLHTEIKDAAGNTVIPVFHDPPALKNIFVDAVAAAVTSVAVPPPAAYRTGNTLDFLVNFSKKIILGNTMNTPSLGITIGNKTRSASYAGGPGGNVLLFRYMVGDDDTDPDGIKLVSPLSLNGSSLTDEAGNDAVVALNNIGALSKIIINPVTAFTDQLIAPLAGIYTGKDSLEYRVHYTEKVWVTGAPSLKLTIGSSSRQALYQNGSGTQTLVFVYHVQPGDNDTNGIQINTSITLNGGLVKDLRDNPVPTALNNIPPGIIRVDGVPPAVKNVTVPPKKLYTKGDTLDFLVGFTEKIRINLPADTPSLQLFVGKAIKKINYLAGSGSDVFIFRYLVQNGDLDKNGIKLDSLIITDPGSITDEAGNHAILLLKNIGALSNARIDAVSPEFILDTARLAVCENSPGILISHALSVKDAETGETLSWQGVSGPSHGILSKTIFTASSNNVTIPANIFYQPAPGFSGTDTLVMQVSDGPNLDRQLVLIHVQPALINNSIGSAQLICTNNPPATVTGTQPSGGNGIYRFNWEFSIQTDSTGFRSAIGTNDLLQYSPPALTSTTWFRRKIFSGECTAVSPSSQITVVQNGLWTGAVNEDWNHIGNWCNGIIPDQNTTVFLYGTPLYSPLVTDTAKCDQLLFFDDAKLTVQGVLQVKHNIAATPGAIDLREGTLLLNGQSAQTLSGAAFLGETIKGLVLENKTGVTITSPLRISGVLAMRSGSLFTRNNLALSTAASIGPSATGTSIQGNITIDHLINPRKNTFHLFGHPFAHSIDMGLFSNNINAAFRYEPLSGNDSSGIAAGWMPFSLTDHFTGNQWNEYTGVNLLVKPDPTAMPEPILLRLSGTIHSGDQEIILSKGSYGTYHVIANPYPAPIDLSLITRGKDIAPNYWLWNGEQGLSGGYSSIPAGSKFVLPPFGAFIAKATGSAEPSMLFTENCKVQERDEDSLPVMQSGNLYFIDLRLESDSIFWDRVLLLGIDSARANADRNDAEKFRNAPINFYSLSRDQKMLSTDARPLNNESMIALGLQVKEPGKFRIRIAGMAIPPSNTLLLHDIWLGQWITLEKNNNYLFTVTPDTASQGDHRFEIVSRKKKSAIFSARLVTRIVPVPAKERILVSYTSPERGNTSIRVFDLYGNCMKTVFAGYQKQGQVSIPIGDLHTGIYLVEIRCGDKSDTQKIIKD